MATNRSYNDLCGLAHGLDLVGERWALLVVRELVLGPRRYTDLRGELPGISSNILAHRLDELVAAGVATRRVLPPPAGSAVYELTEWGRQLEPIILQLGRWGARSPGHPAGDHLSASSLILSLRTNFDAEAAGDADVRLGLVMNRERFHAGVRDGALTTGRGDDSGDGTPDAVVDATPMTWAQLLYGERKLIDAVDAGEVTVDGDTDTVERFLTWFTLPETAEVIPADL